MYAMSYSLFRSQLASTLDKVNDDHNPVMITRQNGKPAVLISLEDFQSYEETAYLLLFGDLPTKKELKTFEEELKDLRELPAQIIGLLTHLPPFTHPMVVLRTAILSCRLP